MSSDIVDILNILNLVFWIFNFILWLYCWHNLDALGDLLDSDFAAAKKYCKDLAALIDEIPEVEVRAAERRLLANKEQASETVQFQQQVIQLLKKQLKEHKDAPILPAAKVEATNE